MAEKKKLRGGVIVAYEKRSHGVAELLAAQLRDRLELVYYAHPREIDVTTPHHFIMVFLVDDLTQVVNTYQAKDIAPPLIIHVDTPEVLSSLDYTTQFPYVEIAPIAQAKLVEKDVTLRINLFREIMEFLERLSPR